MNEPTEFCMVCGEEHPAGETRAHHRVAEKYQEKYGVSI